MIWKLITIDPSMRNLGIAICTVDSTPEESTLVSIDELMQVRNPGSASCWRDAAYRMARGVSQLLENGATTDPAYVVTETQENWFGERGSASKDNEAIQKLYFFTGLLAAELIRTQGISAVYGVTPNGWKGQTPKHVTDKRIRRWLNTTEYCLAGKVPNDAIDALAIARFVIRKVRLVEGILQCPMFPAPIEIIGFRHQMYRVNISNGFIRKGHRA